MGVWAGYLGADDVSGLQSLLGGQVESRAGAGFGLTAVCNGGDPASLTIEENGQIKAGIVVSSSSGSFGTVDPAGPTLSLSRDPFGFHGLFTTRLPGALWFASNLRTLQRLPGVSNRLDPWALHAYLCFSYVPTPLTMTPDIFAMPTGEHAVFSPIEERRQNEAEWVEAGTKSGLSEDAAAAELRQILRQSVERCLGLDPEVGVFLSGGLDSSLIAALLVEIGVKVHLFTLDFGAPFDSELPYARQVAQHLGLPLNVVLAHPRQIRDALVPTAAALDHPFGDGVTVPLYLLGQAAAKQVDVIFSGEGGDQLFGGWTTKPMITAELYGGEDYDREETYLNTYHKFYRQADEFYTPRAQALVGDCDVGQWVRLALNGGGFRSLLHRLRAANLLLKGAQNILPRATQLAEVHGLRMRAPFFDRALTNWTFTLPAKWFLNGATEKYLLKRAAESYLPTEIVWREKRGMGVPTTEWCLGPLRREAAHWLSPNGLRHEGWFDPRAVARLLKGVDQAGEFRRRRLGEKLWSLLMLRTWCDTRDQPPVWPSES